MASDRGSAWMNQVVLAKPVFEGRRWAIAIRLAGQLEKSCTERRDVGRILGCGFVHRRQGAIVRELWSCEHTTIQSAVKM